MAHDEAAEVGDRLEIAVLVPAVKHLGDLEQLQVDASQLQQAPGRFLQCRHRSKNRLSNKENIKNVFLYFDKTTIRQNKNMLNISFLICSLLGLLRYRQT